MNLDRKQKMALKQREIMRLKTKKEKHASGIKSDNQLILFIEEVDLSLDDGPGVCERSFVPRMLDRFSNNVVFFAAHPLQKSKGVYAGVRYVVGHRDLNPIFYLIFQLHLLIATFIFVLRRKPSIIVASPSVFPIVPFVISKLFGIPLASKTTGAGWRRVLKNRFPPFGKHILYPLAHLMFRLFLRLARLIEVTTKQFIVDLSTEFGISDKQKFVVVPNGVETDLFSPFDQQQMRSQLGLIDFCHLVGWVGELNSYAGIKELINAAPYILERYHDVAFVVVGDGNERGELIDLVNQIGLAEKFIFVGHKPYEDLPTYINAFDLCVALWPNARMKQIGPSSMKVAQYLACGIPVVASAGYDFVETNRLGWVVDPENPQAVADAICKGLSLNRTEKEIFRIRAREYVQKELSMDTLVQRRYDMWMKTVV